MSALHDRVPTDRQATAIREQRISPFYHITVFSFSLCLSFSPPNSRCAVDDRSRPSSRGCTHSGDRQKPKSQAQPRGEGCHGLLLRSCSKLELCGVYSTVKGNGMERKSWKKRNPNFCSTVRFSLCNLLALQKPREKKMLLRFFSRCSTRRETRV